MKKVLIISGHPDLKKSNFNSNVMKQFEKELTNVTIHRLDETGFNIDVAKEQKALLVADIVVFQFPFYWYSVPAVLKHWMDLVLSYNFAYGPEGDKLKGKDCLLSFSAGGPAEAYTPTGFNEFYIDDLVLHLRRTVNLTGMKYHPPFRQHGAIYIEGVYNTLEQVQQRSKDLADRVIAKIKQLQN